MKCDYKDCGQRAFANSTRCFDHQLMPTGRQKAGIIAWVGLWFVLWAAGLLFTAWVVYELVTWVVSK